MSRKQSGFTLIEIAIVLVIIGLLLGGVLKGQELINSAKVKNFAQDFKQVPLFIYGYQDKYRALPGDDKGVDGTANGRFGTAGTPCAPPAAGKCATGSGTIDGAYNSTAITDESYVFWQHVRLAGLAAGSTTTTDSTYAPVNADGGRIGIQSTAPIATMTSSYFVCSDGIQGKFAKQLDTTMDDGNPFTGSMRVALGPYTGTPLPAVVNEAAIVDGTTYVVCLGL
ncbi:MAG: prepilin-type N-terminal cleavage/methylation domain-containing protein [Betaproteobacteria bacterium]|nr:prepilin-type N-terminal cleavage/methylation domain-containing protein [Betaproteobacteria bacterium]